MKKMKQHDNKFVKIRCPKCRNEQITFGKVSTEVKCLVCGRVLASPTGGKTGIDESIILEVLE